MICQCSSRRTASNAAGTSTYQRNCECNLPNAVRRCSSLRVMTTRREAQHRHRRHTRCPLRVSFNVLRCFLQLMGSGSLRRGARSNREGTARSTTRNHALRTVTIFIDAIWRMTNNTRSWPESTSQCPKRNQVVPEPPGCRRQRDRRRMGQASRRRTEWSSSTSWTRMA